MNPLHLFARKTCVETGEEAKKAMRIFSYLAAQERFKRLVNNESNGMLLEVRPLGKTATKRECYNLMRKLYGNNVSPL